MKGNWRRHASPGLSGVQGRARSRRAGSRGTLVAPWESLPESDYYFCCNPTLLFILKKCTIKEKQQCKPELTHYELRRADSASVRKRDAVIPRSGNGR
jgi:hypothetical protein